MSLPAVARNVSLDCKKCGAERFHVVVAHLTSESAKVKCEVCGSKKTYKVGSAAKKTRVTKKSTAAASRSSNKIAEEWQGLREKIGDSKAQAYNMRVQFASQQALQHPKFGLGFVTAVTNEKIDVVFEDALRALVHNRP